MKKQAVIDAMVEMTTTFVLHDDTDPKACGVLGEVLGEAMVALGIHREFGDASIRHLTLAAMNKVVEKAS